MSSLSRTVSNASKLVREAIGSALSSMHAGDDKIASRTVSLPGIASLQLTSTTFKDGEPIPREFTPQGANRSPQLSWSGVPADTQELVLIVEDPDAPFANPFVHWIMHRIPATTRSLPVEIPIGSYLSQLGGAVQSVNDSKTQGWSGPQPPMGHGVHHYHFQLFALDEKLNLNADATVKKLSLAMKGHVLADGEIIGTYERTADKE